MENNTSWDVNAVINKTIKGSITAPLNTSDVAPTGTTPKIFKPAPAQIIIKQIGILYASIPGKK